MLAYSLECFLVHFAPKLWFDFISDDHLDIFSYSYSQSEKTKTYLLPAMFAVPGQVVVCRFPNDQNWHRARITKVIDVNFVQVIFVDYGTSCAIHKSQLYYLR